MAPRGVSLINVLNSGQSSDSQARSAALKVLGTALLIVHISDISCALSSVYTVSSFVSSLTSYVPFDLSQLSVFDFFALAVLRAFIFPLLTYAGCKLGADVPFSCAPDVCRPCGGGKDEDEDKDEDKDGGEEVRGIRRSEGSGAERSDGNNNARYPKIITNNLRHWSLRSLPPLAPRPLSQPLSSPQSPTSPPSPLPLPHAPPAHALTPLSTKAWSSSSSSSFPPCSKSTSAYESQTTTSPPPTLSSLSHYVSLSYG